MSKDEASMYRSKNKYSAVKDGREASFCEDCGAWRGCLGLEPTPQLYVNNIVEIFRGINRVLRHDGTVWLNLGDTYASQSTNYIKAKDLMGIPWQVAFALRADGWYLRRDIIWDKPNAMPESAEDRPTGSHEYIFLLSKSDKYFYDGVAIKEVTTYGHEARWDNGQNGLSTEISHAGYGSSTRKFGSDPGKKNRRSVWRIQTKPFPDAHFATFPEDIASLCIQAGTSEAGACAECRTPFRRGVIDWEPSCSCPDGLQPGDLDIIQSPLGRGRKNDPSKEVGRAGMSRPRNYEEGRRPMTRWEQRYIARQITSSPSHDKMKVEAGSAFAHYTRTDRTGARPVPAKLLDKWVAKGWVKRGNPPTASDVESVPCVVLDPFSGAGTTALVSSKLSRDFLGVELGEEYVEMGNRRIAPELAQGRLL